MSSVYGRAHTENTGPHGNRGAPFAVNHATASTTEKGRTSKNQESSPQSPEDEIEEIEVATPKSWVIQIKDRFASDGYKSRQPSSDVSIYRVPASIRVPQPEAYIPQVVSFGPYHHQRDRNLSPMDDYKLVAVDRILKRFHDLAIDKLIEEVGKLESRIRSVYEDSAMECSKETLAWMFTMDACFILEFFLTTLPGHALNIEDHINLLFQYNGHQNIFRWEIMRDIVKLENQIPLFLLLRILELGCKSKETAVLVLVISVAPYKQFKGFPFSLALSEDTLKARLKGHIENGACHLLDLCRRVIKDFLTDSSSDSNASARNGSARRGLTASASIGCAKCTSSCCTPDFMPRSPSAIDIECTPSAGKLNNAGVDIKQAAEGHIRFDSRCFGSTFSIPQITVEDDTEILLRNLLAFEECQSCRLSPEPTIISTYMHLMDSLIDTAEDVELLKKRKVIRSLAGSDEEVVGMVNDLCKGVTVFPDHQYKEVVHEVRLHYNSQMKVWISEFRQQYFSKPWYIVSLVAATLLLGMTAVQTIFTVKN